MVFLAKNLYSQVEIAWGFFYRKVKFPP